MSDNVLKRIYETKLQHVQSRKQLLPVAALKERIKDQGLPRPFVGRIARVVEKKKPALIAEIKKASPSKGTIREDFDPPSLALAYAEGGATCLSVLTDQPYFKGRDEYLEQVRAVVPLPVLRKDFMIDPYQIYESRALGADCILLIMTLLTKGMATKLMRLAEELGMGVLVEVHNEAELKMALSLDARMIGINNRNLQTMEVSLENTVRLAAKIPRSKLVICESGIYTHQDVTMIQKKAKVHSFLVGESLMRQGDVEFATRALLGKKG